MGDVGATKKDVRIVPKKPDPFFFFAIGVRMQSARGMTSQRLNSPPLTENVGSPRGPLA